MLQPSSIIIIGAGLIGLSCADSLIAQGAKRVSVLDTRDGPARGTSFSNSGMIHPSQATPWNMQALSNFDNISATKAVYELAVRSKSLILERAQKLGLNTIGQRKGCLQMFQNCEERDAKAKLYHSFGVPFETVNPSAWTQQRPALFFPDDMSGNAYEYCVALAADLKTRGVSFGYGRNISKISKNTSGELEIQTQNQTLKAEHVIIAAGHSSSELLRTSGLTLKTYAERGFAIDFKKPHCDLPDIPIMDYQSKSAMTVFRDRLRLSGTIGETTETKLFEIWNQIAPNLMAKLGTPLRSWSANRPMSTLGRPFIAQTPIEGLWVNTGHGHMGWTLSAGSGALMADMILKDHKDPAFELV